MTYLKGTYVANRVSDKLTPLHERIYVCRSGSAADTQAISEYVTFYLDMHGLELGKISHIKLSNYHIIIIIIISSHHHLISSSSHHHLIISSYHHIIISSYHHIIISSYHHLITSSHHIIISSYHHNSIFSFLGELPLVKTASALVQQFCYNNKDNLSAAMICAGWDQYNGGQVRNK